jgi:hypothetical protein
MTLFNIKQFPIYRGEGDRIYHWLFFTDWCWRIRLSSPPFFGAYRRFFFPTTTSERWGKTDVMLFTYINIYRSRMLLPLILSNNQTRLRKDQNLCFVNSALQILHYIDDFRNFFLSAEAGFPASFPLCAEIAKLFSSRGQYEVSASELRRWTYSLLNKLWLVDKCWNILELIHKALCPSFICWIGYNLGEMGMQPILNFDKDSHMSAT